MNTPEQDTITLPRETVQALVTAHAVMKRNPIPDCLIEPFQAALQQAEPQAQCLDGPLSNEPKPCLMCDDSVGFVCEECAMANELPLLQKSFVELRAERKANHAPEKVTPHVTQEHFDRAFPEQPDEESIAVPSGIKIDRSFRWAGDALHHVPQLLIEFEPVPMNSPNDAKGWADRDALAAALSASSAAPKAAKPKQQAQAGEPKTAGYRHEVETFDAQGYSCYKTIVTDHPKPVWHGGHEVTKINATEPLITLQFYRENVEELLRAISSSNTIMMAQRAEMAQMQSEIEKWADRAARRTDDWLEAIARKGAALQAQNGVLKQLEWVEVRTEYEGTFYVCPTCDQDKRYGHAEGCTLNAAITQAQEAMK